MGMLLGPFYLRSAGCPSAADAIDPYSPLGLVSVLLVAVLYSFWLLMIYIAITTVSSYGWFAVGIRASSFFSQIPFYVNTRADRVGEKDGGGR